MKLKIKKLTETAILPTRVHKTDAGLDLYVDNYEIKSSEGIVVYSFGIAVEIPENHVGLLFPRSSVFKKPLVLANSVGVIDSSYRGEVKAIFRITNYFDLSTVYKQGERAAQLVIVPIALPEPIEVDELEQTKRGEGGFGSSGK